MLLKGNIKITVLNQTVLYSHVKHWHEGVWHAVYLTRLGKHGSDCAEENQEEDEEEEERVMPASSSTRLSPPGPPFLENHDDIFGRLEILGREVGRRGSFDSLLPSALAKYSCSSRFNSVIFVYMQTSPAPPLPSVEESTDLLSSSTHRGLLLLSAFNSFIVHVV